MSTARDVQFRGIDNVLKGYENMDIPAFSVWCGKEMNFKYEGKNMAEGLRTLDSYLELLRSQGSWAIYSLKVYDDLEGKITSKTPYDGSFNFTVNMSPNHIDGVPGGHIGQLTSEISALRQRIDEMEQEDEDDSYGMGLLGKILLHPTIQQIVPGVIVGITNLIKPNQMNNASIGGVTVNQDHQDNRPEAIIVRLNNALDILQAADPNILVTLEKLARLAQTQPDTFKNYVTMFNAMNV